MATGINMLNPAANAERLLSGALSNLQKNQARLANGLRINHASDDAAGLAISEKFRAQVLQNTQEANNLQTGINVIQTADAALGTQQDVVGRIRELAVQAANGTLTADQRNAINTEAKTLLGQIDNTAQTTEFNGTKLLNGTAGPIDVGTQSGEQVTINTSTSATLNLNGLDLATQTGATSALERLDNAAIMIDRNRANLGAQENRFGSAIETRTIAAQNLQASESAIRDTDVADAVLKQTQNQMQIVQGVFAQTQSNVVSQAVVRLLGVG